MLCIEHWVTQCVYCVAEIGAGLGSLVPTAFSTFSLAWKALGTGGLEQVTGRKSNFCLLRKKNYFSWKSSCSNTGYIKKIALDIRPLKTKSTHIWQTNATLSSFAIDSSPHYPSFFTLTSKQYEFSELVAGLPFIMARRRYNSITLS